MARIEQHFLDAQVANKVIRARDLVPGQLIIASNRVRRVVEVDAGSLVVAVVLHTHEDGETYMFLDPREKVTTVYAVGREIPAP